MDDFFDGLGASTQDTFELAALQYLEELDRKAGKRPAAPAPRPEPPAAEQEELMVDLSGGDLDSLALQLMAETEGQESPRPVRPAPAGRLTRPIPRQARKQTPPPAPAANSGEDAPLSALAVQAARLFEALPAEDQLLVYTLLQRLTKAGEL